MTHDHGGLDLVGVHKTQDVGKAIEVLAWDLHMKR